MKQISTSRVIITLVLAFIAGVSSYMSSGNSTPEEQTSGFQWLVIVMLTILLLRK